MSQQVAPDGFRFGAPAVLIRRHANVEAGHNILVIEREGTIECDFCLGRDNTVASSNQRLAEIGLT